MNISYLVYFLSAVLIFFAMIGYPLSLKILKKVIENKKVNKDLCYKPTVTLMIVAHNEEKVIQKKLDNAMQLNYPADKLNILVSSDNSTDSTNEIVRDYMGKKGLHFKLSLYEVKKRLGKTNAQNEAQKVVDSEILVMTDANAIIDKDAIVEIVSNFKDPEVAYVTGKLCYCNFNDYNVSDSENTYWNMDLEMRKIESDIQTITAGNGALYACRNKEYYDFPLIECHDSSMPIYFAVKGKRCIFEDKAIAYEKAGENLKDEYKRKVRMNRRILYSILPKLSILNIFRNRWFTYFYLGHRTVRYLLWLNHLLFLISNIFLLGKGVFIRVSLIIQLAVAILLILKAIFNIDNKYVNVINYYFITVFAQFNGVLNIITGKAKPFWEKAESTR